ncbi:MAG: phasin family protein [Dehalococcoidia bacterium]|nr:hypothetical protein [Chloroflexota bacterium]MBT9163384.1 hypothetical protein [Chloroflexota bacterium]
MQDLLQKGFSLGLGILVTTKEKVEEVVGELVKKGDISTEEGKKLVSELIEKGETSRKELEVQMGRIVQNILTKLDLPTRKELNELKAEIEQLKEKK